MEASASMSSAPAAPSSTPTVPLRRARSLADIDAQPASPREPLPAPLSARADEPAPFFVPALPPRAQLAEHHRLDYQHQHAAYPLPNVPLPALPEEVGPAPPQLGGGHDRGDVLGVPMPRLRRALAFFGRGRDGTRRRRALMGLLWAFGTGGTMIVVAIALLAVAAHTPSPTVAGVSEWNACSQPLVAWDVIWILKAILICALSLWSWKLSTHRARTAVPVGNSLPAGAAAASPAAMLNGIPPLPTVAPPVQTQAGTGRRGRNIQTPPLFTRLSVFSSLLGFIWFLAAHIFLFTSYGTCRASAPHVWYLTLALLALAYAAVAEIVLVGLAICVLGPLAFLALNLVLLALGRHPLQNPLGIKPPVGKLGRAAVERIPLVMYIPAPPDDDDAPAPVYPPAGAPAAQKKKKRFRFALLRRRKGGKAGSTAAGGADAKDGAPETWEANWVASELPFVRLSANRASCAICLMDFAEPPRAAGSTLPPPGAPEDGGEGETAHAVQGEVDAPEEAEPLRLLPCGHAFHKTCLDPWLTDVSGRCPMCQRPVEDAAEPKPARRRWWRRGRRAPPPAGAGADAA